VNSRLDAIQAAMLRVRLRHVDEAIVRRRAVAAVYDEELANTPAVLPFRKSDRTHTFHQYVVRIPSGRDRVEKVLAERGVSTAVHYRTPVHLQPAMADLGYRPGDFPEAERAANEVLSLPMYASLGLDRARNVARALREAL